MEDNDLIGEDDCAIAGCDRTVTEPGLSDYCYIHAPHGTVQLPKANRGDELRIENAEPHPIVLLRPGGKIAAHLMPGDWVKFTVVPVKPGPFDPWDNGEQSMLGYIWKIAERGASKTEATSFLERLHEKVRAKYGEEGSTEDRDGIGGTTDEDPAGHAD
jgi:hypothetical protein